MIKRRQRKLLPLPKQSSTAVQRENRRKKLPVSFRADGRRYAILAEHLDPTVLTLSLDELSDRHWQRMALRRIRAQPTFSLLVPGRGAISKSQAIAEIQRGTRLGKSLVAVETAHVRRNVSNHQEYK